MNTLSVLLTFALLLAADHLASRLRQAGALPADSRQVAATPEYSTNQSPAYARLQPDNAPRKNIF